MAWKSEPFMPQSIARMRIRFPFSERSGGFHDTYSLGSLIDTWSKNKEIIRSPDREQSSLLRRPHLSDEVELVRIDLLDVSLVVAVQDDLTKRGATRAQPLRQLAGVNSGDGRDLQRTDAANLAEQSEHAQE